MASTVATTVGDESDTVRLWDLQAGETSELQLTDHTIHVTVYSLFT